MKIKVLLFASLAERTGSREFALEVPDGASVEGALEALVREHASIAAARASLATAVNGALAPRTARLHEGDVLALLPPVSGG